MPRFLSVASQGIVMAGFVPESEHALPANHGRTGGTPGGHEGRYGMLAIAVQRAPGQIRSPRILWTAANGPLSA
jgi:hypothetical protein